MPKKTIMIVDDEPDTVKSFEMVLRNEGFDVVTATGGQECLDKLKKERVDLLLVDFFMPEISGRGVIERIREDPELKDIKVAFLTIARFRERGGEILEELDVADYIRKSTDIDEFIARVKKILK